jgi:hypothetical protein
MKRGKKCIRAVQVTLACAALAAFAVSAEVYRWTDENGVTHFSQTPPESGQEAEIEDVPDGVVRPDASASAVDIDGDQNTQIEPAAESGELSAAELERQQITQRSEELQAERAALQRLCNQSRSRLAQIESNRRIYYTNEDGENVRMDDNERVAEVEELNIILATNCK